MIFALAIIPILSIAGFAIDFQITTVRKNKVQTVIDSAVLAGARAMQAGKTQAEITEIVNSYMTAQLTTVGTTLTCGNLNMTFVEGSKDIELDVECSQETSLMQIVGRDEMTFYVSSASTWGIGKLDVAFMFDVSGSMGGSNRMTFLKAAALDAIDTLLPEGGGAATEDVRIAMISYDSMFNAGDYFEDVTGLAQERTYIYEYETVEEIEFEYKGTCDTLSSGSSNCDRRQVCKKWRRNGTCRRWRYKTICIPYESTQVNSGGNCLVQFTETTTFSEQRTIDSTCVWERPGDEAFSDAAPNANAPVSDINVDANEYVYNGGDETPNSEALLAGGYARYHLYDGDEPDEGHWHTEGTSCNPHEPLPLTDSRTDLINYVNALTTNGGTAGQQGIAWAWYMVAEPWQTIFTGDAAPLDYDEPDSTKAIILMTDGSFNREEFDDLGDSFEQAADLCDGIKATGGVFIYSVAFQAPTSGQDILDYCSSGPEFSFSPENGEELSQAYQAIATSISDLRISY